MKLLSYMLVLCWIFCVAASTKLQSESIPFRTKLEGRIASGTVTFLSLPQNKRDQQNPTLVNGNMSIVVEYGVDKYIYTDSSSLVMFRYLKHCLKTIDNGKPKLELEGSSPISDVMLLSISTADPLEENFEYLLKREQMSLENRVIFLTSKVMNLEKLMMTNADTNLAHTTTGASIVSLAYLDNNKHVFAGCSVSDFICSQLYKLISGLGKVTHNSFADSRGKLYIGLTQPTKVTRVIVGFPNAVHEERKCNIVIYSIDLSKEEVIMFEAKAYTGSGMQEIQIEPPAYVHYLRFTSERRSIDQKTTEPCEISSFQVYSDF